MPVSNFAQLRNEHADVSLVEAVPHLEALTKLCSLPLPKDTDRRQALLKRLTEELASVNCIILAAR